MQHLSACDKQSYKYLPCIYLCQYVKQQLLTCTPDVCPHVTSAVCIPRLIPPRRKIITPHANQDAAQEQTDMLRLWTWRDGRCSPERRSSSDTNTSDTCNNPPSPYSYFQIKQFLKKINSNVITCSVTEIIPLIYVCTVNPQLHYTELIGCLYMLAAVHPEKALRRERS